MDLALFALYIVVNKIVFGCFFVFFYFVFFYLTFISLLSQLMRHRCAPETVSHLVTVDTMFSIRIETIDVYLSPEKIDS